MNCNQMTKTATIFILNVFSAVTSNLAHVNAAAIIGVNRKLNTSFALKDDMGTSKEKRPIPHVQPSALNYSTPRILWMYWEQGFQHLKSVDNSSKYATDLRCVKAMMQLNPTWDVRLLDKTSILGNVTLAPIFSSIMSNDTLVSHDGKHRIGRPLASDLLRVELLSRYGGVWADTSVCPFVELDEFIPTLVGEDRNGFYAPPAGTGLQNVTRDDLVSSTLDFANCHVKRNGNYIAANSRSLETYFMIANSPNNPLIDKWLNVLYTHLEDLSLKGFPEFLAHCSLTQARLRSTIAEEVFTINLSRLNLSENRSQGGRFLPICFDDQNDEKDIEWYLSHCAALKKQVTASVRIFILSTKYSFYLNNAANYFHSFSPNSNGLHKLEFVHIPKTGGTSIELAGKYKIISKFPCKRYCSQKPLTLNIYLHRSTS